ncbi:MAG: galactose oxidase-like domain-containing protein [Pyrinomonadaceae bacterium]
MPWTVLPDDSEILAIHVALLSNGKLLIFPGDQHRGSATNFQHARFFNPATNLIEPCDPPTTDVFCSGHAFLADGRLVVGGGTARYGAEGHAHGGGVSPFSGERSTWLYEPRANHWDRVGDMNFPPGRSGGGGRWYPTLVALGNGEVMAFSGHPHEPFADDPRHNNDLPERFSGSTRGWFIESTVVLTGDASGNGYYPRVHVLRDGRVFIAMHIAGSTKRIYDPYTDELVGPDIADTGVGRYDNFWDGPSVLLPLLPADDYRPRVLMAAYQPKIIDLGATAPAWQNTVARVGGIPDRQYANGVMLPTGQVLICGGVSNSGADTGVLQGEIYEPGIDWPNRIYSPSGGPGPQPAWSATPDSAAVVRNYHSVAILLPDGRVWTAGSSKRADSGNPDDANIAEKRIEIYSPSYVGQPRPTISASPDYISYGAPFELETPNAGAIERVALIRCGSTTHAFDSDQRYVALNFERVGMTNRLRATAPPHGNVAPPGQYMLWIVDNLGRPCEQAPILRLAQTISYLLTDRSSFSVHEVEAVLSGPAGAPAVFPNALYMVIEGHLPHEIAAIGGTPSLVLHFDNISGPLVAPNMDVAPNGPIMWEDPDQPPDRGQRVTFAFDVHFPSTAVFTGINNRQVWVEATWGQHRAIARLDLTNQPNPYMTDGPVEWLSTDVRVFRIRRGETRFGVRFEDTDTPFTFLQRTQAFYNTPAGEPQFRAIPENPDDTPLTLFATQGGQSVFNFAFAKVRYRAVTAQAPNVAVFFRSFNSVGTAIEWDPATTYARNERAGGGAIPLLGRQGTTLISIPFFGEPRVTPGASMIDQSDAGNVHTLEPAGFNEFQWHYGAYLDINQETELHFPAVGTGDGPFGGDAQSIKALVRDLHQCLVAEVYFKSPDPMAPPLIVARATPGSSDKLSQRNLAFVRCSNPGVIAISRTVHHTFEIKPSEGLPLRIALPQGFVGGFGAVTHGYRQVGPDELMFKWGNLPREAIVDIFLPAVSADEILGILSTRPGPGMVSKVDDHTVRCRVGDIAYLPIPHGAVNHAGLLSIELPTGVIHGQQFVVTAHQISGLTRRLIGAFELRVQVRHTASLLARETQRLSLLRWIYQGMPTLDRWRPVFDRYLGVVADRVDAFGGDSTTVQPSPNEDGSPERPKRSRACCWGLPTLAAFMIALLPLLPSVLKFPFLAAAVVIFGALWIWQSRCCPLTLCQRLLGLLFGLLVGTAVLAVAALAGVAGAWPAVAWAAIATGIVAVIAVLRRCLRICDEPCCK